jgi:hypothetical protein
LAKGIYNVTIPYYEHKEGIQHNDDDNSCYVILDKDEVDELDPIIWNTFDAVQREIQKELGRYFVLGEASLCVSPEGDQTYIVNFISLELNDNGEIIQ